MAEETDLQKRNFWNFRGRTLTLNWVIGHNRCVSVIELYLVYTPNFIEIVKTFCGQTDILMYLLTDIADPL